MKIHALVAAVALAVAGTAFAAETTTTTTTTKSTTTQHRAGGHKAKARHVRHRMHEQHARTTTTTHRHMASRHMESTHHMGSSPAPDVDVNTPDRRNRMDDAYSNYQKSHQ